MNRLTVFGVLFRMTDGSAMAKSFNTLYIRLISVGSNIFLHFDFLPKHNWQTTIHLETPAFRSTDLVINFLQSIFRRSTIRSSLYLHLSSEYEPMKHVV
jgi:hypothetical protein